MTSGHVYLWRSTITCFKVFNSANKNETLCVGKLFVICEDCYYYGDNSTTCSELVVDLVSVIMYYILSFLNTGYFVCSHISVFAFSVCHLKVATVFLCSNCGALSCLWNDNMFRSLLVLKNEA